MINRIKKAAEERDQGFTLIELLVVILIIGILAGIAIPVFLNQRAKAVDASIQSDLKNAASAAEAYSTDYPTQSAFSMAEVEGAGFVASPGNTLEVSGGPAVGYCFRGWNPEASTHKSSAAGMTYDSIAGGVGMSGGACTGSVIVEQPDDCGEGNVWVGVNHTVHAMTGEETYHISVYAADCVWAAANEETPPEVVSAISALGSGPWTVTRTYDDVLWVSAPTMTTAEVLDAAMSITGLPSSQS